MTKHLMGSTMLAATLALAAPASAEKWDLPMAYSGSNYHSVTGAEFATARDTVATDTPARAAISLYAAGKRGLLSSSFPRARKTPA